MGVGMGVGVGMGWSGLGVLVADRSGPKTRYHILVQMPLSGDLPVPPLRT